MSPVPISITNKPAITTICKTLFDSYPDIACAFSAVAFGTGTESIEGSDRQ